MDSSIQHKFSTNFDPSLIPRIINIKRMSKFHTNYSKTSYIILSNSGRAFRVSEMMHEIILIIDGKKSLDELAHELQEEEDLDISPEILWDLFERELIPRSILTFNDEKFVLTNETSNRTSEPLRLKIFPFKMQLFVSNILSKIVSLPHLLFFLGGFFCLTIITNNPSQTKNISYTDFPIILIIALLGVLIHELGHSSAAIRGGIVPGSIGIRFLLFFPTISINVNDGWILNRKNRIELDLGGVGLQSGFGMCLLLIANYFHDYVLFAASSITFSLVCLNLIPLPRFDGYWLLADVLGIPNLRQTSLSTFRRFLNKNSSENDRWGYIPSYIQVILSLYGLFTIFTIVLIVYYTIQFPQFFITYLLNIPQYIDQIIILINDGDYFLLFSQIISIFFSLAIFAGFILMILKLLQYFKARIDLKLRKIFTHKNDERNQQLK